MAILKHGAIRNSDYGEAQRYLFFEQEPEKHKSARDEHGNLIFRKGLIYSAMSCEPFTFNTECTELNRRFKKNQGRNDIKAHHYIISFAPEDVTEGRLSPQKANALAAEFAESCTVEGAQRSDDATESLGEGMAGAADRHQQCGDHAGSACSGTHAPFEA